MQAVADTGMVQSQCQPLTMRLFDSSLCGDGNIVFPWPLDVATRMTDLKFQTDDQFPSVPQSLRRLDLSFEVTMDNTLVHDLRRLSNLTHLTLTSADVQPYEDAGFECLTSLVELKLDCCDLQRADLPVLCDLTFDRSDPSGPYALHV